MGPRTVTSYQPTAENYKKSINDILKIKEYDLLYKIAEKVTQEVKRQIPHPGNTRQGVSATAFESVIKSEWLRNNAMTKIRVLEMSKGHMAKLAKHATPEHFQLLFRLNGILAREIGAGFCQDIASCAFSELLTCTVRSKFEYYVRFSRGPHCVVEIDLGQPRTMCPLIVDPWSKRPYPVFQCHYNLFGIDNNEYVAGSGVLCNSIENRRRLNENSNLRRIVLEGMKMANAIKEESLQTLIDKHKKALRTTTGLDEFREAWPKWAGNPKLSKYSKERKEANVAIEERLKKLKLKSEDEYWKVYYLKGRTDEAMEKLIARRKLAAENENETDTEYHDTRGPEFPPRRRKLWFDDFDLALGKMKGSSPDLGDAN